MWRLASTKKVNHLGKSNQGGVINTIMGDAKHSLLEVICAEAGSPVLAESDLRVPTSCSTETTIGRAVGIIGHRDTLPSYH